MYKDIYVRYKFFSFIPLSRPNHFAYWNRYRPTGGSTKLSELLSNEIELDQDAPVVARPVRQGLRQDRRLAPPR